jgi:hypothetical protein
VSNRQSRENHHIFLCSPFLPDANTGIHERIANMHSLLGLHDLVPVEEMRQSRFLLRHSVAHDAPVARFLLRDNIRMF